MRNVIRYWQDELKRTFTGKTGAPPDWALRLADGDDPGYHLPGSAVWAVHEHSNFKDDPWGAWPTPSDGSLR